MISEVNQGSFDLRQYDQYLASTPITGITDCKSLYDALHSPGSPSKNDDKRVAIDLAILKQCVARTGLSVRWAPTELMVADALTKDHSDPADLMRSILEHGTYQLSKEAVVLLLKKQQRDRRSARRSHLESRITLRPRFARN